MKILRLRLAGFGPYKNEQSVDFESFDGDGIFLITGKTGAGKSSILDAICYALYDSVPRYEHRASQLRSDHCDPADPTFVELEFTLGDVVYLVHRTPKFERPKHRGGGMVTAQPTAHLSMKEHDVKEHDVKERDVKERDAWRVLAVGPRDVGIEIARVLPIRADQFLQVILLAQNRFQQFLLAKTDERRAVLRTLFGTNRFERLEKLLAERNKSLTREVEAMRQQLDLVVIAAGALIDEGVTQTSKTGSLAWFAELAAQLLERRDSAAIGAEGALARVTLAIAAMRSAEDVRSRQDRRMAAAERLASLEARADDVTSWRTELEAAGRALRAWPFVESQASAEQLLTSAEQSGARAVRRWMSGFGSRDDAGAIAEPTRIELRDTTELLLNERGSLTGVAEEESRLPVLEHGVSSIGTAVEQQALDIAGRRARLAAIPAELDVISAKIVEASAISATLEAARSSQARIVMAIELANAALRLDALCDSARHDQKLASSANALAAAEYDQLLDRRLAGHAAELADALVPGEPCSVCGSTVHPHPAQGDGARVHEGDVDDASAIRLEKQAALSVADAEVQRLTGELERARGGAGGSSVEVLLGEHERASTQVESAVAALHELHGLEGRRSHVVAERETAQGQATELTLRLERARASLDAQRAILTASANRVTAKLAGHASIRERISELDDRLAAARLLSAALEQTDDARTAAATATAALAAQLTELGFDGTARVRAAHRSTSEVEALDRRIREHDDGLAAARSTLAESDLQNLPVAVVDLEPLTTAIVAASTERETASAAAHAVEARFVQLSALVTTATSVTSTSGNLIVEHEQVRELAELVVGRGSNTRRIRLETYVLAARLEHIILAANLRLDTMSGGRYALELDDQRQYFDAETGLGLSIRDAHTGRARATQSLSGGETFLASLALALGLAEIVSNQAGGISLDTLFIDEGFGSLDNETLDMAMSTLDGLRAGGRSVGLISHVDSMKERIPAKLHILTEASGGSRVVGNERVGES